jgi:hypothetical protein
MQSDVKQRGVVEVAIVVFWLQRADQQPWGSAEATPAPRVSAPVMTAAAAVVAAIRRSMAISFPRVI